MHLKRVAMMLYITSAIHGGGRGGLFSTHLHISEKSSEGTTQWTQMCSLVFEWSNGHYLTLQEEGYYGSGDYFCSNLKLAEKRDQGLQRS